jgi:hypothetical protein
LQVARYRDAAPCRVRRATSGPVRHVTADLFDPAGVREDLRAPRGDARFLRGLPGPSHLVRTCRAQPHDAAQRARRGRGDGSPPAGREPHAGLQGLWRPPRSVLQPREGERSTAHQQLHDDVPAEQLGSRAWRSCTRRASPMRSSTSPAVRAAARSTRPPSAPPPRRSELPPVSLLAGGNDSFGHGVLQPALAVRVASSAAWQEWPMSRLVVPLSWRYARRKPGYLSYPTP